MGHSKRAIRRRQCDGKKRHPTFDQANKHLCSLVFSGKATFQTMGVYRCQFCMGFHVGHVMGKVRKWRERH